MLVAGRRFVGIENFALDLGCRPRGITFGLLLLPEFLTVPVPHEVARLIDTQKFFPIDTT